MVARGWATFRASGHPVLERLGGGQAGHFARVTTLIPQDTLQSGSSYEKLLFCQRRSIRHPDPLCPPPICVTLPFPLWRGLGKGRGRIIVWI